MPVKNESFSPKFTPSRFDGLPMPWRRPEAPISISPQRREEIGISAARILVPRLALSAADVGITRDLPSFVRGLLNSREQIGSGSDEEIEAFFKDLLPEIIRKYENRKPEEVEIFDTRGTILAGQIKDLYKKGLTGEDIINEFFRHFSENQADSPENQQETYPRKLGYRLYSDKLPDGKQRKAMPRPGNNLY